MMNDITFNLLKIVISVVAVIVAYYVIPFIKGKIQSDKYKELLAAIDIAVRAAEQTTKGSGMGPIKKEDVIITMTGWLNQKGIDISQKQLSDLIEAAVFNMNNSK